MKKIYLKPQQICISMEKELPIIAASGGGGGNDPINNGDPSFGGGDNPEEPIEEGGAPGLIFIDE